MAEFNHRNKENLAQAAKAQEGEPKLNQAYSIGAVIAVGVLGLLSHYVSQLKKTPVNQTNEAPVYHPKETPAHNFEME